MEKCRDILAKLARFFQGLSLENIVVKLLSSWAIAGIIQNLKIRDEIYFTHNSFFQQHTFFQTALVMIAVFSLLSLPVFDKAQKGILWTGFFVFFVRTLWQRSDFGFYLGAVLVMTLITAYAFKNVRFKKDITAPAMWMIILPFVSLAVVLMITVTVLLYKAYWTPNYDFGIFSQMFYYMKETLRPLTTCERDGLLSHFAVHFSPIYYVLLPIYAIFPSPITLLASQAVISAAGIIPLMLLCKKYNHKRLTTAFLVICYMAVPGLTGGNLYYLHENVFLSPLLLWTFYFFEKKNVPLTVVFSFLTMLVKEDAPVYIVIFGIYLMLSKRNKNLGALLTGMAVVYFTLVLTFLSKFGEGAMVGRFENFNKSGEPITLVGVIMTAVSNPAYLFSEIFQNDRILFLLQLFVPLMFLPFFTKKYSRFVLLAPLVIVNLLSDYGYQHDMGYQYVFGPLAFVIYMCVMNSADMLPQKRVRHLLVAAVSSVMVFMSMYYSRFMVVESYRENMKEHNAIEQAFELIPDDASVAASTFFVANLSSRDEIYELETTSQKADYYVLDLRYENTKYTVDSFSDMFYEIVYKDDYVAIIKRK